MNFILWLAVRCLNIHIRFPHRYHYNEKYTHCRHIYTLNQKLVFKICFFNYIISFFKVQFIMFRTRVIAYLWIMNVFPQFLESSKRSTYSDVHFGSVCSESHFRQEIWDNKNVHCINFFHFLCTLNLSRLMKYFLSWCIIRLTDTSDMPLPNFM